MKLTRSELRILHRLLDIEQGELPLTEEKSEKVTFDLLRKGLIEIKLTDLGRRQVEDIGTRQ